MLMPVGQILKFVWKEIPTLQEEMRARSALIWWAHQDLNLEPTDYESAALTVELWARELNLAHSQAYDPEASSIPTLKASD